MGIARQICPSRIQGPTARRTSRSPARHSSAAAFPRGSHRAVGSAGCWESSKALSLPHPASPRRIDSAPRSTSAAARVVGVSAVRLSRVVTLGPLLRRPLRRGAPIPPQRSGGSGGGPASDRSSLAAFTVPAVVATIAVCRSPSSTSKGVPGNRREGIEAAIVAGGRHTSGPNEAWIAADPGDEKRRLLPLADP
jgi:hypothetical protein